MCCAKKTGIVIEWHHIFVMLCLSSLKVFYAVIDNVLSTNNSKSWTTVNEKVNITSISSVLFTVDWYTLNKIHYSLNLNISVGKGNINRITSTTRRFTILAYAKLLIKVLAHLSWKLRHSDQILPSQEPLTIS